MVVVSASIILNTSKSHSHGLSPVVRMCCLVATVLAVTATQRFAIDLVQAVSNYRMTTTAYYQSVVWDVLHSLPYVFELG